MDHEGFFICHCYKGIKSNFLFSIHLQPDGSNLWYFRLGLFNLTEFIVWNIEDPWHWVPKIHGLENHNLLQRLDYFSY